MNKIVSLVIIMLAGYALGDGPVIQTSPFMRPVLESQDSVQPQSNLGFTGKTAPTVITNTALAAMVPQLQSFTNQVGALALVASDSTNAVYDIRQFGALLDGQIANNCSITLGTTTLTAGQSQWVPGDVGKIIMIEFAGTNGLQNWSTTIATYVSATQITVANAPVATVSGVPCVYGHDDSAAWQAALNFVCPIGGKIFEPINTATGFSISIIGNAVQDVGDWRSHYNAQVYAPAVTLTPANASSIYPLTVLCGPIAQLNATVQTENLIWHPVGSIIWSTCVWGQSGTNWQNVFNFSAQTGGSGGQYGGHSYGFNHIAVGFENIRIVGAYNNSMALVNLSGTARAYGTWSSFDSCFTPFALANGTVVPLPTFTNTYGVIFPQVFNYPSDPFKNCAFNCFYDDVMAGENVGFDGCDFFNATNAVEFANSGGNLMTFSGTPNNIQGVKTIFDNPGGIPLTLLADNLNIQNLFGTLTNWSLANDPFSGMFGHVTAQISAESLMTTNQGSVNGAKNLVYKFIPQGGNGVPEMVSGPILFNGSFPNGGLPQANSGKFTAFEAYNFSQGAGSGIPRMTFLTYNTENFANESYVSIGGPNNSDPIPDLYGTVDTYFFNSPDDVTTANMMAHINGLNQTFDWFGTGSFTLDHGNLTLNNRFLVNNASSDWQQVDITGYPAYTYYNGPEAAINAGFFNVNGATWPNIGTAGNSAWAIQQPGGNVAFATNGAAFFSGGVASTATGTVAFSATGVTNTLPVNLQIFGLMGSNIQLTNYNTGFHTSLGSPGINWQDYLTLQPGDAIWGSGLTEKANRAF